MASAANANGNAHGDMVLMTAALGEVGRGHFRTLMTGVLH
jgi:hypothetical protein